jgi:predicted aminopeptidase
LTASSRFLTLLALLGIGLAGCSPTYVLRAGYEQAKILSRRQPIERMIADPRTDPETRAKLQLVLEARAFAVDSLRLDVGQSYTTFAQLDSDTLVMVVSAARPDTFRAHTWWFPIVGSVPYKGFFREEQAQAEARRLQARGLDTYVRPAGAFSTLGWFNDPLYSSLLRYDSLSLANTVIHEVTHNTVYWPGQAAFNESFANFVGARGAIAFFCTRFGPRSAECVRAGAAWRDELRYGAFLSALVDELEALYARDDLTAEQKVALREPIFAAAQTRFRDELQPQLEVLSFAGFARTPLNNATLIGRRLYYRRLDLFEEWYQRYGDLQTALHAVIRYTRGEEDPYAALDEMLWPQGRPLPPSDGVATGTDR